MKRAYFDKKNFTIPGHLTFMIFLKTFNGRDRVILDLRLTSEQTDISPKPPGLFLHSSLLSSWPSLLCFLLLAP